MANEIHIPGPTGQLGYINVIDATSQRANGITLEAYSSVNYANYAITATEDGSSGVFVADFPVYLAAGEYDIILYIIDPDGSGLPTEGDTIGGSQSVTWREDEIVVPPATPQFGDIVYEDIKTQVIYNLGRGQDTDILAQIDFWAKLAMRYVINWRDGWFLDAVVDIPTVIGQQEYDFPGDYKDNMKIMIRKADKWVELDGPIDIVEGQRRFTPASEGEPVAWSHSGYTSFLVWPVNPTSIQALQCNYQRYIADLEEDDDSNTLTAFYPELLIALMTAYGFKYLQEREDAKDWVKDADKILMDLHANYVSRVMGRDFNMSARADSLGNKDQSRGIGTYMVIK